MPLYAAACAPAVTASPTPEPLTDVIYDENGMEIRYTGYYTVRGTGIYLFSLYSNIDLDYVEGNHSSPIGRAKLQVNGKRLQWVVTIPEEYGFGFANVEVAGIPLGSNGRMITFSD